jgi:hypothetical protein
VLASSLGRLQGEIFMNDLEKFHEVWNGYTGFNKQRGEQTKKKYENILFSIWKHHQDWDAEKGFQIKCSKNRTVYRVRDLAEKAGLLHRVGNYSVGDHTNYYKKNHILFDAVFRSTENQYGKWLEASTKDIKLDIIQNSLLDEVNNLSKDINNNIPYVDTSLIKKGKPLNYDLEKLHKLADELFSHYYDLMMQLNESAHHYDLKFISFISFDKKGLPTGRPYTAFCSTLNPKKKHTDNSGEFRPDFLKRIGLADYYEVYDIKSEIPRINYLFHTGEWEDDDFDFYSAILDCSGINIAAELDSSFYENYISRGETRFRHYNDSMKQLFMRIYFGKGTDKQSFSGYIQERKKRYKRFDTLLKNGELDVIDVMCKNIDDPHFTMWKLLCNATRQVCGAPIGNLIFWFSFFLETEVKIELLKRGKKVYNVYDGFYYNEDISSEIKEILKEKAESIYNNYMIKIK